MRCLAQQRRFYFGWITVNGASLGERFELGLDFHETEGQEVAVALGHAE
jgi:hypothetical protein